MCLFFVSWERHMKDGHVVQNNVINVALEKLCCGENLSLKGRTKLQIYSSSFIVDSFSRAHKRKYQNVPHHMHSSCVCVDVMTKKHEHHAP